MPAGNIEGSVGKRFPDLVTIRQIGVKAGNGSSFSSTSHSLLVKKILLDFFPDHNLIILLPAYFLSHSNHLLNVVLVIHLVWPSEFGNTKGKLLWRRPTRKRTANRNSFVLSIFIVALCTKTNRFLWLGGSSPFLIVKMYSTEQNGSIIY